jgi:hypothetical protein
VEITQVKYIEAPMAVSTSDRISLLNIWLRDMQTKGARIFKVSATDTGWEVEYMGEPEVVPDDR